MPRRTIPDGWVIGWVVTGWGGGDGRPPSLMQFNGRSSYYSHGASHGGEVFFFKEDAEEVRDDERRTLLRLASDEEQRGRRTEAADWKARAKEVALIEVQMPPARVPSSNLRALRIADEEASRTGYLQTAKRMKEMLAQFYEDDRRQGESRGQP